MPPTDSLWEDGASTITKFLNPAQHPSPPFYTHIALTSLSPASQSATSTRLVTLAGQIGRTSSGELPSTLSYQVQVALKNVSLCLEAAGATRRDIISIRQYVVGLDPRETQRKQLVIDWLEGNADFAEVSGPAFRIGEGKPPNTVLGVSSLVVDKALYEVEVVAAVAVGTDAEHRELRPR